jgi:hypothetical protein
MYNGFVIVFHPTLVQGNFIIYLIHCASTHKSFKFFQIMCTPHVNLWNQIAKLKSVHLFYVNKIWNKKNIQHYTKDFKGIWNGHVYNSVLNILS